MTSAGHLSLAARLTLPRSGYVCARCRLKASTAVRTTNSLITLPYASRRHASWLDSDKLRKKIWGSETPPGQEDPYGKESVFDRKRREREQEGEQEGEHDGGKGRELELVPERQVGKPEGQTKYVKATTAEGLETVGGPDWGTTAWETRNVKNSFEGFMESERTEGRIDTSLAVHRALVETYALKEAGLPLVMDYYSISTEDYAKHVAEGARFEHDANGQMALVLESEELRQSILECVTPHDRSSDDRAIKDAEIDEEQWEKEEEEEEVVVDEDEKERLAEGEMKSGEAEEKPSQTINEDDEIDSEPEAPELPLSDEGFFDPTRSSFPAAFMPASDTWRDVSLEDSAIKFAVLKRVMQLTGRRIPDPEISAITTPKSLLVHLVKKQKVKRMAEALLTSSQVAGLPNVQILNKRYGPIDREMEVGRWKVIKEELEKRGLPVTGGAHVRNVPEGLRDEEL